MNEKEERLNGFGSKVKELRKEKGYSLAEVGKAIGISHNFLSEVERGKKEPSDSTVRALANFFEVDEDELFSKLDKVPMRTLELVKQIPELQKLLSEVKRKFGDNEIKLDIATKRIVKLYQEFLEEEE